MSRQDALAHMPTLDRDRIDSGYLYYDAQVDDARLTLAITRTAALDHGAVVANHAPVTRLRTDGDGRVSGAWIDTGDGELEVRARVVVSAAGVWVDDVGSLNDRPGPTIRPARGVHLVVPRRLVENDVAVILPVPGRRSTVFAVPWGEFTYVGTTDTDYDGDLDHPYCTADDVEYLLANLNHSTVRQVGADDVVGTWAGLRPLLRDAKDKRTADLSRRHRVSRSESGLITVSGGKLTTWRRMAEDTVDEVLAALGHRRRCRTKSLPLRGAEGYEQVDGKGLGAAVREHLVGRYGADATTVIEMVERQPALGDPLVPGLPYLRAEALFAVEHEMARTIDDVLARRTRARLLARDPSAEATESVAELMAGPLGWSPDEKRRQVEAYRSSVAAERAAVQSMGPDQGDPLDEPLGWVPGVRLSPRLSP